MVKIFQDFRERKFIAGNQLNHCERVWVPLGKLPAQAKIRTV